MPYEILYSESLYDGPEIVYIKPPEINKISRINTSLTNKSNVFSSFVNVLKDVFLPEKFPESVSDDYVEYQIWDTVQAFCSTVSGILSTHAILKAVGVGSDTASALSAAISWVLKDGVGMCSRILFAWSCGTRLDSDCKKWRFFADILNDAAIFAELFLLFFFPDSATYILCLTTSMKGIVGVAGGATRAAVTQHQAVDNNMGDVSAKDGSQETCVNLIGSAVGIVLLSYFADTTWSFVLFFLLTVIHLYANFKAVSCLQFKLFNMERYNRVILQYLLWGLMPTPRMIASEESVILGYGLSDLRLSGKRILLGCSVKTLNLTSNQFKLINNIYKDKTFWIAIKGNSVYIALDKGCTVENIFEAYFHGILLGLATLSGKAKLALLKNAMNSKVYDSSLNSLFNLCQNFQSDSLKEFHDIEDLLEIKNFASKEFIKFYDLLQTCGWDVTYHQFNSFDLGWRRINEKS